MGTAPDSGLGMRSYEAALRASDGRKIEPQTEVAREPESPRVRTPLTVANEQVGGPPQLVESAKDRGRLAKG
jgi:hypothetical protein